jgi:hypothetical protein
MNLNETRICSVEHIDMCALSSIAKKVYSIIILKIGILLVIQSRI